jgi:uncharacterized protein YjbJ (UPF0337 family)
MRCAVPGNERVDGVARRQRRRETTVSGEGDKTKGRIKQAVGDLTDDDEMKREGKIDEGAGKVKEAVDNVKDRMTKDD